MKKKNRKIENCNTLLSNPIRYVYMEEYTKTSYEEKQKNR